MHTLLIWLFIVAFCLFWDRVSPGCSGWLWNSWCWSGWPQIHDPQASARTRIIGFSLSGSFLLKVSRNSVLSKSFLHFFRVREGRLGLSNFSRPTRHRGGDFISVAECLSTTKHKVSSLYPQNKKHLMCSVMCKGCYSLILRWGNKGQGGPWCVQLLLVEPEGKPLFLWLGQPAFWVAGVSCFFCPSEQRKNSVFQQMVSIGSIGWHLSVVICWMAPLTGSLSHGA